MMHSTTGSLWWLLVMLVSWLALLGGATWVVLRQLRRPRPKPPELPSPLDLIERRYAAGELSRDEFDDARARLREHQLDL